MARYTGPVCKLCRNKGQKLFLKGERCYSNKCAVEKRPYGSGQHGKARKKLSEYAIHLHEKQKVRHTYLVLEKQFSRYFAEAARKKGVTGTILLQMLESRLDSVLARTGFTQGRKHSRQLIRHKHFTVNGRTVNIPSYRVKPGDEIGVKEKSVSLIKGITEQVSVAAPPAWLTVDQDKLTVKLVSLPEREQLDPNVKEQLIIEYYSK
ncbi:MAG: 30S ribosomal protein S4 [bacterium]